MSSKPKPHILFVRQEVAATVSRLMAEIGEDYQDKRPLLIGILKSSLCLRKVLSSGSD